MALVLFFVSDPAKGVAEMKRVVCPGGTVASYVWDMFGGGVPLEPIQAEMRALGVTPVYRLEKGLERRFSQSGEFKRNQNTTSFDTGFLIATPTSAGSS